MLIIIGESWQMRSNESVIRRTRINRLAPRRMLGAQETIGKISSLRDNVCTDIADDRPVIPAKDKTAIIPGQVKHLGSA